MFNKLALKSAILVGITISLSMVLPLRALADDDDPPSRVARLSYAQGSVSFQPAGTDDWVSTVVNRPVTLGDKLWCDNDGRVELQLDGSLIRLAHNTGISFLNLNDNVTQIELSAGTVVIRVRRLDDDESYEVDTPNLAFSILRAGLYRVTVDEQGQTTAVKVNSGDGEVTGGGAAYSVHAKEYFSFAGTDQLDVYPEQYRDNEDQFDAWSDNRDAHWAHSTSAEYVSPDVVGYEDLDDNGDWRATPEYGNVWFPRTRVEGWAPYHYGHWAYIAPWGYTWVDDEPWGFAPFHYGRWVFVRGGWGWVPSPPRAVGVVYVRPVYAPALVAWVGVGGGGAGVAWFALGPREVYVPSYHVSRRYVERVNVSNTGVETTVVSNYYNTTIVNKNVTVTNVTYVNQRVHGAVAATSSQAFTSAQPVARNAVRVDEREVSRGPVRAFTPAEVPSRQAVLGTARASTAKPPAAMEARRVVAKEAPPPPPPAFEKRQEAIRNNGGRPLSGAQLRQIQPAPAAQAAPVRIAPVAKAPMPAQNAPPARGGRNRNYPPAENQPAQAQPNQPANPPAPAEANKPAQMQPNQPGRPPAHMEANRPEPPNKAAGPPANQPPPTNVERPNRQPNRPEPPSKAAEPPANQPPPTNVERPNRQPNRPEPPSKAVEPPANQPAPNNVERPNRQPNRPEPPNKPTEPPARQVTPDNNAQPKNRPPDRPTKPENVPPRPDTNKPAPPPNRPEKPAPPSAADEKRQQEQQQSRGQQEQERKKAEQQQQQKEKQQRDSKKPPKDTKDDRPPTEKP
ncbi:MAG: DUF6600 domain-containing protein [Candidatus Acidiferrales bacterium]